VIRNDALKCCAVVADVHTLTRRQCRDGGTDGKFFVIRCSNGKVINIKSAVAGYSVSYNPLVNQCPWNNCTRPIPQPATLCNGRFICNINQAVVLYPQHGIGALCSLQQDGNFIEIKYTCVPGTTLLMFYSQYMYTVYLQGRAKK